MASATLTISDAVFPQRTVARDVSLILGGAALTAVCAQVIIPVQPVPFTLQTLAVYLCGITLGSKRGVLAMLAYLAASVCHLPVLAGRVSTWGVTGGYLIGFVFAVWLLGSLAERGWDRTPWKLALAMIAAEVVVMALGSLWLSAYVGGTRALQVGVAPFLLPELVKMLAVSALLPGAWLLLGKRSSAS